MTDQAGRCAYTVIYDGRCGVCTRLVNKLAALDRRRVFELVPSQGAGVSDRFPWIPPEAYARALQLVRSSDHHTWEGSAAVEEIVNQLRAGWVISWIFSVPFGRRIANRLYNWFADHRHELGCGQHCQVQATPSDVAE